jgi:hypothetical protein
MSTQDQHALALKLSLEWQSTVSILVALASEDASIVTNIDFNPEYTEHPFYLGKLSVLNYFKDLADSDVDRYKAEGHTMIDELEAWRTLSKDLLDYFVHIQTRHANHEFTCDCDGCTLYTRIKEAIDLRIR